MLPRWLGAFVQCEDCRVCAGCPLEGWRDPFIFRGGQQGERWQMVMATGKCRDGEKDGTVILYSADTLEGPWRYDGVLFEGDCRAGRVAECPGLVQVRTHDLSVHSMQQDVLIVV
jgi:sucrose-6-phosphate hydrolase SacC (GH32 family)